MMNSNSNWFKRPKPVINPSLRLFCFPYAGGNASSYVGWVKSLPEFVELIVVEPPGRAARMMEQPFDSMEALVDDLFPHFQKLTDVPYIFFGHSLGGRVAYEICLRCHRLGIQLPGHFIASASRAPHIIKQRKNIYDLPEAEFIDKLRSFNGTPEEVLTNTELMELLLPMLRADFEIADTYLANPLPLDIPISVWAGTDDHEISKLDLQAWADCCNNQIEFEVMPGGHLFVDSHAAEVLAMLTVILTRLAATARCNQDNPGQSLSFA